MDQGGRKRKLLQFSLRALLLTTVLVAVAFGWPHVYRRQLILRLAEYSGRDLEQLPDDEKERVYQWIDNVLKPDGSRESVWLSLSRSKWHIYKASSKLGSRLYLVELIPTFSIPGNSYSRVHRFDRMGSFRGATLFNIGYRAWPESVAFDNTEEEFACLKIEMRGMWSGGTRQFYRITDQHVELLRSEELDGTFRMGDGNLFEIEAKPPDWSDWERMLQSSERVDQLRGLASFWSWDNLENLKPITAESRIRLEELSMSNDPWIREESQAALQLIEKGRVAYVSSRQR